MQELDNFKKNLRQFSTYHLLEKFSSFSMDIFNNEKNATKFIKIKYLDRNNLYKICNFNISQWDLIEICYYSIIYGNDYRNKIIEEKDIIKLVNLYREFEQAKENAENFKGDNLYQHLICIANMQFDFQSMPIKNKFNRLYHIMTVINKNPQYDQSSKVSYINFSDDFKIITGLDLKKYTKCLLIIVLLSIKRKNTNILELIGDLKFDIEKEFGISINELILVIENQTKKYEYYKNFDNWNILKSFPIVRSERFKEKYIISNLSSLVINIYSNIYWNIRNYYFELGSRKFTTYFGYCFEYYLQEVFTYYKISATKIEEVQKEKRPDWLFESDNYCFLIEQKAALFPIDTKTNTSEKRFEKLDNFLNSVILKGVKQLDKYCPNTNKIVIRICLLLDDIYVEELIEELVFKNLELKNSKELIWVTSIEIFEKMLQLLSTNKNEFEHLIEKKINLEKRKSPEGRSLEKLFSNIENEYIKTEINYFNKIINDIKEKVEDNNE